MSLETLLTPLCRDEDMAEGKAMGFAVPGQRRKVIVLRYRGKLHGWLDSCPHYEGGTPMAWKKNEYLNGEGTHLACHSHGALFDRETGECVAGACLGKRLTRVELTLGADGMIRMAGDLQGERA